MYVEKKSNILYYECHSKHNIPYYIPHYTVCRAKSLITYSYHCLKKWTGKMQWYLKNTNIAMLK